MFRRTDLKFPPEIREPYFSTLWYFVNERQSMFYNKINGVYPLTDDPILQKHKFTNVFRAADRASQYLIKNVIYAGDNDPEQVVFRTLLFKIFNRPETWEYIVSKIGEPKLESFSVEAYGKLLDDAGKIWSNAYMMSGNKVYGYERKHWNYLRLVYELVVQRRFGKWLVRATGLDEIFSALCTLPLLGGFLSYQLTIDISYSDIVNHDEDEWMYPGAGTIRGITRCFDISKNEARYIGPDIMYWLVERQEEFLYNYNCNSVTLFGRRLHVPDIANCFCEVDKYCRAKFPDSNGYGRKRIKQNYIPSVIGTIEYFFPPKWNINENVSEWNRLSL